MSNAQTIPATDIAPARAGFLGIGYPKVPHDIRLAVLAARTGHELELRGEEGFYYIFDWSIGDALGEGPTRALALDCAEENA